MTFNTKPWSDSVNRKSIIALAVAIILLIIAAAFFIFALLSQVAAPSPVLSGDVNKQATPNSIVLPYSKPLSLTIPSIDIRSQLFQVGQRNDGTIQVPEGEHKEQAAWYKYSPAPGQYGASVIVGHVDTAENGPSIFFNLGKLKTNDKVFIERADGKRTVFNINSVRQYAKMEFPTRMVYTPENNAAELRLITCSGNFVAGSYTKNIVVYATLESVD